MQNGGVFTDIDADTLMKKKILPLIVLAAAQTAMAQTAQQTTAQKSAATTKELTVSTQKLAASTKIFLAEEAEQAKSALAKDAPQKTADVFIKTNGADALESIRALGVSTDAESGGIVPARLTAKQITAVAALPGVEYISLQEKPHKRMNLARKYSNADPAHRSDNTLKRAYMGKDIVVGVVDDSFDYCHTAFLAPDGSWRIRRVWNQGETGIQSQVPEGFTYGCEYTTEEEIREASHDEAGEGDFHGTHVAGIAAGGDMSQPYYGVAPEADIVLVPTSGGSTPEAVKYVFKYAKSAGKPAVVNLSLGTHIGPHDGTSLGDQYFDSLTGEGCIIVGSAGNEGEKPLHARKTFTATDKKMKCGLTTDYVDTGDETEETEEDAEKAIRTAQGESSDYVVYANREISACAWGSAKTTLKARAVIFDTATGDIVASSPEADAQSVHGTAETLYLDFASHGAEGKIELSGGISKTNDRPNFELRSTLTALAANRSVGIVISGEEGTQVDVWNDDGNVTGDLAGWTAGDTDCTSGEIGGTGKSVISVGSYHTRSSIKTMSGADHCFDGEVVYDLPIGALSPFSSKGPTLDGRMKPDVSAPGELIVSAFSAYSGVADPEHSVAKTTDEEGDDYYYTACSGTSMASPYVAGSVALWLEACPTLSPDDVRDILQETAVNDEYTASGTNDWGYGKIDTYAGLAAAVKKQTGIARVPGSDIKPRADVSQLSSRLTVTFRQDQGATAVTLFDAQGVRLGKKYLPMTTTGTAVTFDTTPLTPGVYLVHVTSEQGQPQTFKVSVR